MAKWGFLKNIVNIDRFFASGSGGEEKKEEKKDEKKDEKKEDAKLAQHVDKVEVREEANEQEEKTAVVESNPKQEEAPAALEKPAEAPKPTSAEVTASEKPAEDHMSLKESIEKKAEVI